MPNSIYVAVRFTALPGETVNIIEVLEELAQKTREEPGCLSFDYFQSRDDPLQFISVEHWQDPAAEDAHWHTPHVIDALQDIKPSLAGEITKASYAKLT
ncbi:antibiotic biosynthesis monooxygenase [Rhodobacteraceae bacterium RKSG542]|uniref:putative quinol monooxygenase n=1 Tax=Pseudovibrio flavus TaxID=2529854 RepID=UPI0012BD0114|nr:putative quinol monooxygenase [Pseudovibrio flavus]MTI16497.1 antibiotic biosynthesis monooxygenase [Pseudovibrio flavus]